MDINGYIIDVNSFVGIINVVNVMILMIDDSWGFIMILNGT